VGFLLLKGFSLKEIADFRDTKVKTVQQQSQSIYQKTGLVSRSELAAFSGRFAPAKRPGVR
tara:strand:+ start:2888 stop:3070 length:183 start_codon:yes stop_codon:yes gene_type:complete